MSETRLATKVGGFIVLAIILLAMLLLVFSKGMTFLTPTYTLRLRAESVGGLKARSSVLISGVTVGSVVDTELSSDGKGVAILLKIHKRYGIHADARFRVEQIGLLGDQYVVIYPTENKGPLLKDGDEVECESPFNLQEVARSTIGFIERVDEATKMLKDTVTRINTIVLTERNLTNLAQGVSNLRTVSDRAVTLVDSLSALVSTNTPPVSASMTNLARFSGDLNKLADDLRQTVSENRAGISSAIKELENTSRSISTLARDLESGKGLAGGLLKDEKLRAHLSDALANLAVATSNMANYGLLYKPKKPKKESESESFQRARSPKDQ